MSEILKAVETNPREGGATFTLKNRFERLIWSIVWNGFGIWTPVPFHAWRRVLVRTFGGKIAPTAKIYPGVRIWHPRNLELQPFSCLGRGVNCYSMDRIILEPYSLVSQGAHLCCGSHDVDDPDFQLFAATIRIERNAWVAAEAFVGPGVVVGEGAVLGARAVTVKSLLPWTIYAGNPARPLRERHHSPDSRRVEGGD
ncbi:MULTISPECIES: putative colanic acid biosynthesis acetyltransferase [unclassified Bradyrhizobium]|uniref:putative colanic acid biosynthesis acetyltransferase n=1 Tax=unclassified Bradyrhizobium TaxID=2631580 RepID=UPI00211DB357|nr:MULTISPECIES: putative colanic acid biosynthesis acetyltransferase [unclassified Bradyrhizobium]MDD1532489.1 putative colanic acid biosynthesis acetyltransferase [Bradyrhizobium sp. WBOS8]MDD1582493.1 putative colanic acid biosynthesis acetyltransferase [Bradyrhizobium sp. WBOS4]UUO50864.1 putative colanic acid biosynthesis acetyltransferase [Bradyrhizobium sp. WBOS04]UUO58243.1 putative colanic acid biosynthesis acetyltransferase [Bradyrhizobium sp. WBOS08]